MYIANSRATTKKKGSITDTLTKERKWSHLNVQLKPQKAEKEWKKNKNKEQGNK